MEDLKYRPRVPYIVGDGIGPEIWRAASTVIDAAVRAAYGEARTIDWVEAPVGSRGLEEAGEPLPEASLDLLSSHPRSIKGPLGTPVGSGARSLNVALRLHQGMYACIRPTAWIPSTPTVVRRPERLNVVLFREVTEDVFTGNEAPYDSAAAQALRRFCRERFDWRIPDDAGVGIKHISRTATRRLVRAAIRYAIDNGRRRVTLVHKGNAMKFTEGAFRRWGYELAEEEFGAETTTDPEAADGRILVNDVIADAMMQAALLRPEEFDVIATPNLNGDYLSDLLAAQVGGVGLAPGVNINPERGLALYEPAHGTAPRYAGLDKANPTALIRSGQMLLADLGWPAATQRLDAAFCSVFRDGVYTYDLARLADKHEPVGTSRFAEHLIEALEATAA